VPKGKKYAALRGTPELRGFMEWGKPGGVLHGVADGRSHPQSATPYSAID